MANFSFDSIICEKINVTFHGIIINPIMAIASEMEIGKTIILLSQIKRNF